MKKSDEPTGSTAPAAESLSSARAPRAVAAFWRRLFATLFDLLFLLVVIVIFLAVRGGLLLQSFTAPVDNPDTGPIFAQLKNVALTSGAAIAAFALGYFLIFETWFARGTFGKVIFCIRIASAESDRLRFRQILVRFFSKFIIGGLTLGLSWVAALFSKQRQAWHDRIAKTVVVPSARSDPE